MNDSLPPDLVLLDDFREYIIYDGFLPHEADRIRGLWNEGIREKAAVSGDNPYVESLRRTALNFLAPGPETEWIYQRIETLGKNCNAQRFRFDLRGFLQPLQLATYSVGDFFDWHMDFASAEASHRKLSVSVQLDDAESYEGGDLQFMINNRVESAPRTKGCLIVFPSFIQHRVTKVTAGKRRSIVGWLSGPPYR